MNTSTVSIAQPTQVVVASEHNQPLPSNLVDDFFGGRLSTTESRHDSRPSSVADVLPLYTETPPPPPSYSRKDNQPTLAEYLFKFGFIFFPFWILGACILFCPLTAPPQSSASSAWLPDKSDAERQTIITRLRKVEVRWAQRSLYALITLLIFVPLIAILIWQLVTTLHS